MKVNEMFESLLTDLHYYFDKEIVKGLYTSLNETMQFDHDYLSQFFCNNQGIFFPFSLTCVCDSCMFGYHCRERGIVYWKSGWTAMQIIFGIAFGILALVMWLGFISKIKENINLKGKLVQLFITPKYLVLINLVWITTARFFFIIIDPFCQRKLLSHSVDVIVYDMIYSSYVAFYLLLLIVWNGLQTVFNMGMKTISKRCYAFLYHDVKIILVIALILAYPAQIIISFFQASRTVDINVKTVILFVFFIFFMFLYFATIGLICELKRKLYNIYEDKKLSDDLVTKYINAQGQNQTNEGERNYSIDFLLEIMQQNLLEVVENYVFNKKTIVIKDNTYSNSGNSVSNSQQSVNDDKDDDSQINNNNNNDIGNYDINDQSEYGIDYEKEILKFNNYQYENICDSQLYPDANNHLEKNNQNSNNNKINNKEKVIVKRESKPFTDKKKKFELTQDDLKAMNKIFRMSYAFLVMTMLILSFSCSISFQNGDHSPTSILITICLDLIAEIVSICIIYSLFFRNLKSQEYQNLKIIGEIDKYMNQDQESMRKIVYNEFTNKAAFKRFNSYVKGSK